MGLHEVYISIYEHGHKGAKRLSVNGYNQECNDTFSRHGDAFITR